MSEYIGWYKCVRSSGESGVRVCLGREAPLSADFTCSRKRRLSSRGVRKVADPREVRKVADSTWSRRFIANFLFLHYYEAKSVIRDPC